MKLPLAYYGNPILRKKAAPIKEITEEIRQLAANMIETMHAEKGIGLAAPQVHVSLAIFVTNVPIQGTDGRWEKSEDRIYINPKIIEISPNYDDSQEGCLSIPRLYGTIPRPNKVKIEATDLEGNLIQREFTGLDAYNFLHENDHLNGVLFIDRLKPNDRKRIEPALRQIKKKYNTIVINV